MRGQTEALVVARILGVADADQGGLEQAHDRRQHLLPRQTVPAQIGVDARPDARQGAGEDQHAIELVASRTSRHRHGSDTACGRGHRARSPGCGRAARADPHVGPGGRDGEGTEPHQRFVRRDRAAVGIAVAEALAGAPSGDARYAVGDVAEPGGLGRRGGGLGVRLGREDDGADACDALLHVHCHSRRTARSQRAMRPSGSAGAARARGAHGLGGGHRTARWAWRGVP